MKQNLTAPSIRPAAKISTEEVAARLLVKPQTVRRAFCVGGHYLGLIPIKLASRRLLWDAAEVDALVAGKVAP
ncbi:MAG: hypothetical protein J5X22_17110 [Candidatus Accumulibacter sp.]|uniref:helix-turn-helix transcriptional regulator n=1 Tax=Accumulibacter sp. TaxID=2053492 RepID=UPI001AC4DAE0|nr:hypothetical protein [Accumulibacter sp.]MBN8519999.1 hypothetical protein [Accumulibacter sp.]MBO3712140.1 hypothetical protein [Accumulibacter sp.]